MGLSTEFKEKWLNRLITATIIVSFGTFVWKYPGAWEVLKHILGLAGDAWVWFLHKFGIK